MTTLPFLKHSQCSHLIVCEWRNATVCGRPLASVFQSSRVVRTWQSFCETGCFCIILYSGQDGCFSSSVTASPWQCWMLTSVKAAN